MDIIPLGAGQEVGRSCIIASLDDVTVMLDCGMHMGYSDERKFPDFDYFSKTRNFDHAIDCVIISHFHLDHCGALPYFTEVIGYNGPIYMTYPTRAVLPILLEDCQKILSMRSKDEKMYTEADIANCMKKIVPVNMNETIEPKPGFIIRPYYAGHVIGAAMFYIRVGDKSLVYTGDYSTNADKHLGTAWIDCLRPDLLISESTYGNLIRDCRKSRERKFLQMVHACVKDGGRVLIPIFALGRAQELCILIENYWKRMGLQIPVYFAGGLTEKANEIYKRFISYTNINVRQQSADSNVFDFKYIKPYEKNAENYGPCVIFSTPAMLHSGLSLRIFKNMCQDPKSLVILPGFCMRGTIGDRVLNGAKEINVFGTTLQVNAKIENLAFSAHADAAGVLKIVGQCKPRQVMLVHGDKNRMKTLKQMIRAKYPVPVHMPANGMLLRIPCENSVTLSVDKIQLGSEINLHTKNQPICKTAKIKRERNKLIVVEMDDLLENVEQQGDHII
ncbi:integrator complex subunit 11 [Enteropsectra breve]|nr:integrator complex subunit 11 [Enteropsectra breve]